ncbi:hypothetical protein TW95_gp1481 [Pandoravirus inopinatum]|uniref:Transmembrane protein n=1 Tax=Pandoravirus inopinatum TaxID=1605721 RepID=A0A0B5J8I0_9VIRU|nr:hypothetical protein TW95_gp1481 [Pandoravirus inopinatum]AJF98215.1 hypothetical protein [Pandoravirus inopinatum]
MRAGGDHAHRPRSRPPPPPSGPPFSHLTLCACLLIPLSLWEVSVGAFHCTTPAQGHFWVAPHLFSSLSQCTSLFYFSLLVSSSPPPSSSSRQSRASPWTCTQKHDAFFALVVPHYLSSRHPRPRAWTHCLFVVVLFFLGFFSGFLFSHPSPPKKIGCSLLGTTARTGNDGVADHRSGLLKQGGKVVPCAR